MEINRYRNTVSNLFEKNKILVVVIIVLAGVVIYSQYLIHKKIEDMKIVIIPKGMDQTVTLQGRDYGVVYLNAMASYISQLYWSYNSRTVIGQYQQLATFYTTENATNVKAELFAKAEATKKNDVSKYFLVTDITTEISPTQVIEVSGWRTKYILKNKVEETAKTLRIEYTTRKGYFQVVSLSEK